MSRDMTHGDEDSYYTPRDNGSRPINNNLLVQTYCLNNLINHNQNETYFLEGKKHTASLLPFFI